MKSLCPSCGRTADTAQLPTTAIGHLTVCTFCGWDRTNEDDRTMPRKTGQQPRTAPNHQGAGK